jgi:hypothetical protein
VYARDYSGATGEDNFDKSALPEVMQVRRGCVLWPFYHVLRFFQVLCLALASILTPLCCRLRLSVVL